MLSTASQNKRVRIWELSVDTRYEQIFIDIRIVFIIQAGYFCSAIVIIWVDGFCLSVNQHSLWEWGENVDHNCLHHIMVENGTHDFISYYSGLMDSWIVIFSNDDSRCKLILSSTLGIHNLHLQALLQINFIKFSWQKIKKESEY